MHGEENDTDPAGESYDKKHPCPDCRMCQFCSEVRCRKCQGWLVRRCTRPENGPPEART